MSDKPKRKRAHNRRRKFLLMIVLPILALMAGFVALKPQMDAWLASDPFTPQCHFEQDRLYITSNSMNLHSINSAETDIQLDPAYFTIDWSPDGQFIATMKPAWNGRNQLDLLTTDGEVVFSTIANIQSESPDNWSPDGRYLKYFVTNGVSLEKYLYILDTENMDIAYLTPMSYVDFAWSPDGKYVFFGKMNLPKNDKSGVFSWTIVDLDNRTAFAKGIYSFPDENMFNFHRLGWSQDSQQMYFLVDNVVAQYSLTTETQAELKELTFDGLVITSFIHNQYILILTTYNTLVRIDTETLDIRVFDGFIGRISPIAWIGDTSQLLYYDIYLGNTGQLAILDTETFITRFIDDLRLNTRLSTMVSPDGHYILYLLEDDFRLYNLQNRQLVEDVKLSVETVVQWINIDNTEYLIMNNHGITYLWNPETNQRCKIGVTSDELEFQARPS